jgi:hypothetical protein
MTDHAATDATLSVPATEGTEAEAAQQSMSDDAAEHQTPPGSGGQGAT